MPKKSTWLAQNLYAAKIDDCCYLDFVLVLTFSHKPIAMFRNYYFNCHSWNHITLGAFYS